MTGGQEANGIASAFVAGMGAMFIISYVMTAKWYRSTDGRMMMAFGVTITLTCSITLTLTIFDFSDSVDWLRYAQAILMVVIGLCFAFYTTRVWRAQTLRKKRYEEEEDLFDE